MFRVPIDFNDEELDAYQTIMTRIAGEAYLSRVAYFGLIAMGAIVALGSAGLLFAAGAISEETGAVLTALVFGAFWLGAWGPSIATWLLDPKIRDEATQRVRREMRNSVLTVGGRRLAITGDGWRGVFEPGALRAVTTEGGLILLWRPPDLDPYPLAIPTRCLTPAQQAELAAFPLPRQEQP